MKYVDDNKQNNYCLQSKETDNDIFLVVVKKITVLLWSLQ